MGIQARKSLLLNFLRLLVCHLLEFALERLLICLEEHKQDSVTIVAEARGKKEDNDLHLKFLEIVISGTDYYSGERFKKIDFKLVFREKKMNTVGTQIADLVAYPTARFVLDPDNENPAFKIIRKKFYEGQSRCRGFKVFP